VDELLRHVAQEPAALEEAELARRAARHHGPLAVAGKVGREAQGVDSALRFAAATAWGDGGGELGVYVGEVAE
jgi:hypothetical protein